MKTIQNTSFRILLCVLVLGTFFSCKKDDTPDRDTVEILVLDENNLPISNANVQSGESSSISDANGKAIIKGAILQDGKYPITINAEGFFKGYLNVYKAPKGTPFGKLKLLKEFNLGKLDTDKASTLNGTDFILQYNGEGFVDEKGNNVDGEVIVKGRYISADDMDVLTETFPGGDFEAVDNSGNEGVMISYGFTATAFEDNNGNEVFPTTGSTSTTMNVSQNAIDDIQKNGAEYWVYDPDINKWRIAGAISVTGRKVTMPVSSFTFGNCDKIAARATITGQVICKNDSGTIEIKAGASTSITGNQGYAMKYITTTNEEGYFRINVGLPSSGGKFTFELPELKYTQIIDISPNSEKNLGTINVCSENKLSGSFTYDGKTYSGETYMFTTLDCGENYHNVDIFLKDYGLDSFSLAIRNIPNNDNGTYKIVPITPTLPQNCETYASFVTPPNLNLLFLKSGTLTKTGARKFTFAGISEEGKAITGFGEY